MAHIKSGFQVSVWLLFTIGIVISYTTHITKYTSMFQSYEATILVAIGIAVLTSVCLSALSYWMWKKQYSFIVGEKTIQVVECICLFTLLGAGIYFHTNPTIVNMFVGGLDQSLFQMASVSQFHGITDATPLLQHLYVAMLHVIFLLLGNIFEVGIFVQFLLLLVGTLSFYMVVRKVCSRISAMCFLAVAIFCYSGFETASYYHLGMFLFAYSGIVTVALYQYACSANKLIKHVLWSVIAGSLATILLVMDIVGVLAIIAFVVISVYQCVKFSKELVRIIAVSLEGVVSMVLIFILLEPKLQFLCSNISIQTVLSEMIDQKYLCLLMIPVLTFSWQKYKDKLALGMCLFMVFMAMHILQVESNMPVTYCTILIATVVFIMSLELCIPTVVTVTKCSDEEESEEEVVIFIPKQMEIPRRELRKKIEFTEAFDKEVMDFDYEVDITSGYDIE